MEHNNNETRGALGQLLRALMGPMTRDDVIAMLGEDKAKEMAQTQRDFVIKSWEETVKDTSTPGGVLTGDGEGWVRHFATIECTTTFDDPDNEVHLAELRVVREIKDGKPIEQPDVQIRSINYTFPMLPGDVENGLQVFTMPVDEFRRMCEAGLRLCEQLALGMFEPSENPVRLSMETPVLTEEQERLMRYSV